MADYTRSVETAERTVFRLKVPTNLIEVAKAMSTADKLNRERAEREVRHVYDDDVIVEADEEEIRFIITTKDWSTKP